MLLDGSSANKEFRRWRIVVVFCIGLQHGLGVAGVLFKIGFSGTHFVLAPLSFNLGVELGRLAVIMLCFLALGGAMDRGTMTPASLFLPTVSSQ